MTRRVSLMLAVAVLSSPVVRAQDHNVELSGTAGWVFSDGVTGSGDFARIDPKDAFSWGLRIGFLVNENVEVGGLFNLQSTSYELGSVAGGALDVGDVSIYNYHGYVAYNFGVADAGVRPYFLGGLGVTQYGSFTTALGGQRRDRRRHEVLDHVGARPQDVPRRRQLRHPPGRPLDPDLHQVRRRGRVVRPLLGLLHGRRRPVLQPVGAVGRHLAEVLTLSRGVLGGRLRSPQLLPCHRLSISL